MEPPQNSPASREVHLLDYWKVIQQRRYTVLAIVVLVVAVAVLKVALATPTYESFATVEIKPEARTILPGQEQWVGAEGRSWIAEEMYFNTQLQVLQSRDLAAKVFHGLHLGNHPMFAEAADPVGAFAGLISVKPIVNTRLVRLGVIGPEPKEITEWANVVAQTFVRRNVDQAAASFHEIMDEIQRGMVESRASLGRMDTERFQNAADLELYIPESQQEILRKNLETYNRELADLRVTIGTVGAELDSLIRIRSDGGDIMALQRISQDAIIQDLNSEKLGVERDLERMASEKRPRHPEHLARRTELDQLELKIAERMINLEEELREDFRLARAQEKNLEATIRRTEEEAYRVQEATAAYKNLKTDAESKRKVYDIVAETMERLTIGAQLVYMNNNVSVLDQAQEPRHPVRPRKRLTIAFGVFMGLLMGVGAALFLDYLDNTIHTPDDIEQFLGLSVLAIIPKYRNPEEHGAREAFQSLRTSILFSSGNREKRVLLFSSAGPQEGKSGTVEHVAKALVSAGDSVVVVDCDLRRPTQHRHLGVSREPGVTNYLLDGKDGEFEPFLQKTSTPNLSVLACGPVPPNPPELVGSAKFKSLLGHLKSRFDWVIVDSPPVASLADSVVLASLCDMMIMVIKHNENDRDLIRRCVKRLRDIDADMIGAVLNAVDVQGSYYNKYYYANYYAADTDKKGRRRRRPGRGSGDDERSGKVAL